MDSEDLISWLNSAYLMEKSIEKVLSKQISDAKPYPRLQKAIKDHINVTQQQAEMVKKRIEALGSKVSSTRETLASSSASLQGSFSKIRKNALIKNGIMNYATEHFEIATYQTIMVMADLLEDDQTFRMCERIIAQEEKMAETLEKVLPGIIEKEVRK